MKVLEDNIDLIKKTVLEIDGGYIDLKPLAARVHLKLPGDISSMCTRLDVSNIIMKYCHQWGISVQDGHRLILSNNVLENSGVNDIVVECIGDEIRLVSGKQLIDSVIDQCGFANAHDITSSNSIILTQDSSGRLVKSENSYWPDTDLDADLDMHE